MVSTNGIVTPAQDFEAYATTPGLVEDIYVDLGEHVKKGQELLRMDDSEARKALAAAEANLKSSEAALQNMQQGGSQDERLSAKNDLATAESQLQQDTASLTAMQKLQTQGAASANEVALAQHRVNDDNTRIAQLRARGTQRYGITDMSVQQAQLTEAKAAVTAARTNLANVDIRAPFAGTVYAISVAQYDYVQPAKALLDMADLTQLQIHAYFDEPDVGKLAAGQPVKIVWEAKPNRVWHGHIVQAPTTIIQYGSTRNVGECLISVDDAKDDLLPNTNVTVTVTTQTRQDAMSLPREALHTEGQNDFVYVIQDGTLVRRPVQVGSVVNQTRFELVGGLNVGDVVALGALSDAELHAGLRVVKAQP
jgi:HlyD family secretion protein